MKNDYYRIPVCIFLFIVGTFLAIALSELLNVTFLNGSFTFSNLNAHEIIGNIISNDKQRQLFIEFEILVLMICIIYFVSNFSSY